MRFPISILLFVGCLTLPSFVNAGDGEPAEPAFSARKRTHWAFQPPVRPPIPPVDDAAGVRTPVDAFIRARLQAAGLHPAVSAQRTVLLRRVTFDLTGLPPTLREQDDFLNDTRADAYVRVVERLLASPHYGERWAQHWLDVARYAESNGYEADGERQHAWRYRDYVVRSFNDDKPYDRFLTEQLAGDLLAKDRAPSLSEPLIAAGFNRCGPVHQVGGNVDPAITRNEVLTEMTNAVGSAFLGLTVACARCHNHKFDPFTQADYYRLQAFFSSAQPKEVDLASSDERAEYKRRLKAWDEQLAPLRKSLANLDDPYRKRLMQSKRERLEPAYRIALDTPYAKRTEEQKRLAANAPVLLQVTWDEIVAALTPADRARRAALRERMHEWEAQKPPPPAMAWTLAENGSPRQARILKRGDPLHPAETVPPAFPRILRTQEKTPTPPTDRLALAHWLTRPEHPLTARVVVNRLWQHHFGRGLVATPNDFGLRGTPPSHPELLDWLACELTSRGWSLKHVHRLMVLSATYQQASRWSDPRGRTVDPDNLLLARMNRRRLEGEALRDNALAVSGSLNRAVGGPMIRTPLEPEVYELIFTEGEPDGLWPITPDPREHVRRSLYLFNKRNLRLPLFEAFDQPDTLTSCPVRPVSTYAPQALILFNGSFMRQQALALAERVLHTEQGGDGAEIVLAYRLALARPPNAEELRMARDFLHEQAVILRANPTKGETTRKLAFVDFCLALLNRNEFVYVE